MPGNFLVADEFRRLLRDFSAGIALDRVPDAASINNGAEFDPLRLRPIADVTAGIEQLLGVATDVPIAWRFGEYLATNTNDLLTVRALSSKDIGEALGVALQNQSVLTNVRTITHRSRSGGELIAVYHGEGTQDHIPRFIFQSIVSSKLALFFQEYSDSNRQHQVDQRAVCFGSLMQKFDREIDFIDIEYRDCELMFGFSRDVLNYRLADRDGRLVAALDCELRRKTSEVPLTERWKDRIRYYIRSKHLADVSLDEICGTFGMQRRTLGRLLRNEGTTFTDILKDLRRERALHLVRNTGVPLKRVAAELGFNSDASFNMAFKSWTGTTPMKFRKATPALTAANDAKTAELALAVEPKRSLRSGLLSSWSQRTAAEG